VATGARIPAVTLDYLGLTDDVREWSERIDL